MKRNQTELVNLLTACEEMLEWWSCPVGPPDNPNPTDEEIFQNPIEEGVYADIYDPDTAQMIKDFKEAVLNYKKLTQRPGI